MRFSRSITLTALLSATTMLTPPALHAAGSALPSISDSGYSTTRQDEKALGDTWVRMLKGSAKLYDDPVVVGYLEDLLWDVVEYSELTDRQLELVVLDNPTLNAFAVPGGIVGIHSGLLQAAESEDELASVIAHELAHLSQRHYAAQIEEERRNSPLMMAALLGSLLIAAADGQGGAAAVTSTMAASQQARLAFSRQNEREADYIGMQTLAASGFDPGAMPNMFSRLQSSARFGQKAPEFLLTHPVTESRIADSLNRAASLSTPPPRASRIDYAMVRARILATHTKDVRALLSSLKQQRTERDSDLLRYATAYTALKAGEPLVATEAYTAISEPFKQKLPTRLLGAEMDIAQKRYAEAAAQLEAVMKLFPDNYPANALYARLLLQTGNNALAVSYYRKLSEQRPNDTQVWYNLAEAHGKAGNTLEVHIARTEYFLRTGNIDLALRQLQFAQRTPRLSSNDLARLNAMEDEAKALREQIKKVM